MNTDRSQVKEHEIMCYPWVISYQLSIYQQSNIFYIVFLSHRAVTEGPIPYRTCSYWGLNNYRKIKHYIGVIFRVEEGLFYVLKK